MNPDPNDDTGMLTVYDENLRPWRVRVVQLGEAYGRDDCLVHEPSEYHRPAEDPLVEFYDGSQSVDKFGPRGQFVSRYYVSTLLKDRRELCNHGLLLYGAVPEWRIDSGAATQVVRWLAAQGLDA
ncbi:MAG: hypothetical protein JRD89_03455 [Deltaproteobacteria bacterium]|nr:hypothetical protein [Deltaproteobacteria bacterium]